MKNNLASCQRLVTDESGLAQVRCSKPWTTFTFVEDVNPTDGSYDCFVAYLCDEHFNDDHTNYAYSEDGAGPAMLGNPPVGGDE